MEAVRYPWEASGCGFSEPTLTHFLILYHLLVLFGFCSCGQNGNLRHKTLVLLDVVALRETHEQLLTWILGGGHNFQCDVPVVLRCSCLLQYNRVWVADPQQVWRSAEITRDFRPGDSALELRLESGSVSIGKKKNLKQSFQDDGGDVETC